MGNVEAVPISPELGGALAKVAAFALVQALVYLILRKSSGVFSPSSSPPPAAGRSLSFRPMRSMTVRRVLAAFSDVPVGVPEDGGAVVSSSSTSPAHVGADDPSG